MAALRKPIVAISTCFGPDYATGGWTHARFKVECSLQLLPAQRKLLPLRDSICYSTRTVRRISCCIIIFLALAIGIGRSEIYKLANGESVTGELLVSSANDNGVQVKVGDGDYKKLDWSQFSQDDLKKFRENKKLEPLVESFIEITRDEKIKRTEVTPVQPPRLELPPRQSLIAALLGSGPGILILLLVWGASVYAGYEVCAFRGHPVPVVCGVSAVLPIVGPIIFLCIPTKVKPLDSELEPTGAAAHAPAGTVAAAAAAAKAERDDVNPMLNEQAAHPSGLHISHHEEEKAEIPKPTTFQRGQFTFNRRFFETKFSGFFSTVRRDHDRDMVLVFKSPRGQHVGHRISRIAANDLHIEEHHGAAIKEVQIHFQEIQEIVLKHKDA